MSYIGQTLPADTFQGFTTDSFTGDGSATTFTLSKAPFSENGLIVVINNVIQKPTTNFTVSGTTLTIVGTAVASGDVIYAIHTSGAVPSTLASKVDVNGLSDGIILDADADTTISADTDDQIDFKLGGTDFMSLTTTGATITSSSAGDLLTLKSTDAGAEAGPNLVLFRDSASPANNDVIGRMRFEGDDNEGNKTVYAQFTSQIIDKGSSGGEDSSFQLEVFNNGAIRDIMSVVGTTGGTPEVVFNEASQDVDFRVESNGHTDALFVDAGQDEVFFFASDTPDGSNRGGAMFQASTNERAVLHCSNTGTAENSLIVFNNGNGTVGTIKTNSSATSFNTSSDYRLKENVNYTWDATTELKKLKPAKFNFKADASTTVEGFLAHEVSSIVPIAVAGDKDGVDENGDPEYQGIDQSKLVPLMVKTIQELEARITTLEG